MSYKGWYNQKDVRRDLTKLSGIQDFDETCVIVGEQPPPRWPISDDDNETQLLRLYGGTEAMQQLDPYPVVSNKPDLEGIIHMLRMVDNYDDETSPKIEVVEPTKRNQNEEDSYETIVTISKLNPHVEEFVPLTKPVTESRPKIDASVTHNVGSNKYSATKTVQSTGSEHFNGTNNAENFDSSSLSNKSNSKINVTELKQDEIIEMRKQLKHKISDASKTNCVKVKRDRNIAMATLLKLYSQSSTTSPVNQKPLKLIAPNYFETKLSDSSIKENIPEQNNTVDKGLEDTKQDANLSKQFLTKEEVQENLISDKEVKASVDKVNKWLKNVETNSNTESDINTDNQSNRKEAPIISHNVILNDKVKKGPKPVTAFLGPVMFRRKEGMSKSPSLAASDKTAPTSQVPLTSVFVPSEYANELTKNYTERAKAKEAVAHDIWTKLENELKAKDKLIKAEKEKGMTCIGESNGISSQSSDSE